MNLTPQPLPQFAGAPLMPLIVASLMMQPLSTDLYLASLPGLADVFGAPASTAQLTLSLFALGFGGAQLIVGPLSDRFGRRPVLLSGLTLYVISSALCGFASSIKLLIFARFLQALGCCSAVIIARAIVRDAYEPEHSARIVARASSWLSLAPLLGPILGSYLQVAFGWRAAFAALGIFSACLLALASLRLPETNAHKNPRATHLSGLLASYRLVLGSRDFWRYTLPGALSYGALFAFISGSSFVLIRVLQVPTAWFGYCFAFGVSGYMAGTLVCRRLLPATGIDRAFRIGTTLSLVAGALFLAGAVVGIAHWSLVLAAMFLTLCAQGINYPIAQAGAVTPFPRQAGTAAGLLGAVSMAVAFTVGTAVGVTHDGTLYPLAMIDCALGLMIFASARLLNTRTEETA